jgi:hypothetical protein
LDGKDFVILKNKKAGGKPSVSDRAFLLFLIVIPSFDVVLLRVNENPRIYRSPIRTLYWALYGIKQAKNNIIYTTSSTVHSVLWRNAAGTITFKLIEQTPSMMML